MITEIDSKNPFPHLHLLVSGGNTQLILMNSFVDWKIIGATLDDAAGECFDKIGRMMGLPYPAGVYLSQIAGLNYQNILEFPISMQNSGDYNFSYSGLKTSVRYFLQKQKISDFQFEKPLAINEIQELKETKFKNINELGAKLKLLKETAISAQFSIVKQLELKLLVAIKELKPKTLGISGGVSASPLLRDIAGQISQKHLHKKLFTPKMELCGDNAIMIALAGIAVDFYK